MIEENNNIGEQPATTDIHAVKTGFVDGIENESGSPLGKFKDANTLLDAYNELQSEFTRKCQRLSEAEKKLQEVESDNKKLSDNTSNELPWKNKISEFVQSHKNASELMEDIVSTLAEDEKMASSEDGLEKAYMKAIEKNYVPQSELANNNDFLEKYIYSNDQIKNKIIGDYVSTLQHNQSPLTISTDGFSIGVATSNNIRSLEDARKYVENMFRF